MKRLCILLCAAIGMLSGGGTALAAMTLEGDLKALPRALTQEQAAELGCGGEEDENNKEVPVFLHPDGPGGKRTPVRVEPQRATHGEFVYLKLTDERELDALGLKGDTLLFFDMEGNLLADKLPGIDLGEQIYVTASPGGKAVGVDQGENGVRTWHFFSFPGFRPLGRTVEAEVFGQYGDGLEWVTDDIAVLERGKPIRNIFFYRLGTGTLTPVFHSEKPCEHRFTGVEDGKILALRVCSGDDGDDGEVEAPIP